MDIRLSESKIRLRISQSEFEGLLLKQQLIQSTSSPMGLIEIDLSFGTINSVKALKNPMKWLFTLTYLNPEEGASFSFYELDKETTVTIEVDKWTENFRKKKES